MDIAAYLSRSSSHKNRSANVAWAKRVIARVLALLNEQGIEVTEVVYITLADRPGLAQDLISD